ncbi:MAG: ADP-ribosyl-(dinitrogen reductase) hydrolase [Gammaproteobacteria bacterium]|nr:ADP-ribosyl-(dinitrogen reductase) hydrolase [Gammaproteobacteria bacterium]
MGISISKKTRDKLLSKHKVTEKEVAECFHNRDRVALRDTREDHQTNPPTWWLISETNHCRALKLIFMVKDGNAVLKSAFEPNQQEADMYDKSAKYL